MFGIGIHEILMILVVGLVVLGPKKMSDMARALGGAVREFRRVSNEITSEVKLDPEPEKKPEAETAEVKQEPAEAGAEALPAAENQSEAAAKGQEQVTEKPAVADWDRVNSAAEAQADAIVAADAPDGMSEIEDIDDIEDIEAIEAYTGENNENK